MVTVVGNREAVIDRMAEALDYRVNRSRAGNFFAIAWHREAVVTALAAAEAQGYVLVPDGGEG